MIKEEKNIFSLLERISGTSLISIQVIADDKSRVLVSPGIYKLWGQGVKKKSFTIKKNILLSIVKNGNPKIIKEIDNNPEFKHLKQYGIRSLVLIPGVENKQKNIITCYYTNIQEPGKEMINTLLPACQVAACLINITSMDKMLKTLTNRASIDGLTGLYNYRFFREAMSRELLKAERFKYPVSIAMVDVDNFKNYNDTFGHPKGDIVLKEIAGIISKNKRSYDIATRYGGEEFSIILPYANKNQAISLLERIRKEVSIHDFPGDKKNKPRITISAGISSFPENTRYKSELINCADQALYLAKEEGKNRTCTSLIISKNAIRFGFCRPTVTGSPFYPYILQGVNEVIKDVGNVELDVAIYEKDLGDKKHMEVTRDLIDKKIDAVGISSMAGVDLKQNILELNKADIPVFLFNTPLIKNIGRIVSCIGFNHKEAGMMVAKYIIRILRNKGKIAIIEGLPEIASIEMKEGFIKTMKKSNIKIVECHCGEWIRTKAKEITADIIKHHPDIDAIWGENDEMALGAMDAIMAAGKLGNIFSIGTDGNKNAFESIKKEQLTATLNTNPIEIGKILMRTVIRNMIKEEKVETYIKSPINMVDLENINESLKAVL
jgi:diguanylate cyclase (GGDEF)-like protein